MLELNKIYLGDCLEVMKEIDDESVDCIACDLPYGVTNRNIWDEIIAFDKLWEQYNRISKKRTPIILFSQQPFTTKLINSNIKNFRYDIIWEKPLSTGFLNANKMPLRNHEHILLFYKNPPVYNPQKKPGKPYKMARRSDTDNYGQVKNLHQVTNNISGERFPKSVINFASDKNKLHPTQKPLLLLEYLIKTYTNEGDLVLDNCCGSGTTLLAANNLKRKWIGIEKEEKYFNIAKERLSV